MPVGEPSGGHNAWLYGPGELMQPRNHTAVYEVVDAYSNPRSSGVVV
jgi:hypothetical protein